jgi:molybdenum-dependent DNA-binding transcriptional regulator ModE
MTVAPVLRPVQRRLVKKSLIAGRRSRPTRHSLASTEALGRVGELDVATTRAFVIICEVGSISGAAAELGYSQPGLSQRVKAMEQALGCRLFHRHSKGVTPTETGVSLLPYTRVLLAVAEALAQEIARAGHGTEP